MTDIKDVVIYGSYGKGNLGDDLLMIAVLHIITKHVPLSKIVVTSHPKQKYINSWFPNLKTFDLFQEKSIEVNLLVYGGGTQIFHFPPKRSKGEIGNLKRIYHWLKAKYTYNVTPGNFRGIKYRKSVAVSIGIGPFITGSKLKQKAISWLSDSDMLCLRDDVAYNFCQDNGMKNIYLYPDLIYNQTIWSNDALTHKRKTTELQKICIVVRDWDYNTPGNSYMDPLIAASKKLISNGYQISFLSFAAMSDSVVIERLENNGLAVKQWNPLKYSITEYINNNMTNVDIIISARAHGLIIGSSLKIPAFAINIEPKLQIINEQINGNYPIWSAPFSSAVLISIILDLNANWISSRREMIKKSDELAEQSLKTKEVLSDYILKNIQSEYLNGE